MDQSINTVTYTAKDNKRQEGYRPWTLSCRAGLRVTFALSASSKDFPHNYQEQRVKLQTHITKGHFAIVLLSVSLLHLKLMVSTSHALQG